MAWNPKPEQAFKFWDSVIGRHHEEMQYCRGWWDYIWDDTGEILVAAYPHLEIEWR